MPRRGIILARRLPFLPQREELLPRHGTDGADLVVVAEFVRAVKDRVDVQRRGAWFVGQFAQALDEAFLEGVGEVGLGAEEDDAAFRDWVGVGGVSFDCL